MEIAFLSSYTCDFVVDEMKRMLRERGSEIDCYIAPFGQFQQEVLDENSQTRHRLFKIVIVSLDGETLLKMGAEEVSNFLNHVSAAFSHSDILVHNGILLRHAPLQCLEWNTEQSSREEMAKLNCALAKTSRALANVHIVDLQAAVEQYGLSQLIDHRMAIIAKAPFSAIGNKIIARQLVAAINAGLGSKAKCLVVDLDNLLWGGTIGEDGVEKLVIANDGLGRAFYDLQQAILALSNAGVVLAIVSKNNEEDAMEVLDKHPGMLLRSKHFAAHRINWQDKATNLKEIAEELNIGLNTIVFLDDSEHEREYVKSVLPSVIVPDMPKDPCDYQEFVASLPFFETFVLTNEDRKRSEMYVTERERKTLQHEASSVSDFLHSLEIKLKLEKPDAYNLSRIAQLTHRTNQFNLTTRRYSESEIQGLANDRWEILALSCSDRFGELGIIGVAMLTPPANGSSRLDNLMLSCRVLGRGIEKAFLALILDHAKKAKASEMWAEFIPTKKNVVAAEFLPEELGRCENGWYVRKTNNPIEIPKWIKVE